MTSKEFREKLNALKSQAVNAEGDALREIENKIKALREEFNDETAVMQRESVKPIKKNKTLVASIREAMQQNKRSIFVQSYTTGEGEAAVNHAGVDGEIITTEMQGLLEPLYAKSALSALGVRWYKGLPQGDIQIPIMGAGTVGWAGELAAASASTNTFSHVLLHPKRLTAYVDISKQLIVQDVVGAEEAIRRDLVNAINDKLEATIFGNEAGTTTQPKGMFYGDNSARTPSDATSYAKLVKVEAGVEEANIYGNVKYLLSPGAKADLRGMAKNGQGSPSVFSAGEVDGVPAIVTSNVAAGKYIYGDFSCLAVASWGNIEIVIDEATQAVNGCVRLIVNAYFDAKIVREAAFAYGRTR